MRSPWRQTHPRPMPAGGFTLAEAVIATTLTVLVAGSTVGILRGLVAGRRRVDRQMSLQQQARAGANALAAALRNACRAGGEQGVLEGTDDWLGDMPADRVRFFTVTRQPVRPGRAESDVVECEFGLSRPTDGSLPALMRRTDPTLNDPPDEGGVVEQVAESVLGLDLAYHDGARWRDDWPKETKGWPTAVRIRLAVLAQSRPLKVWTATRLVDFPRRQAPKERKEP